MTATREAPGRWWHTIELPDGTVDAWWDFRPLSPKLPWPDLHGKRCLDVGTAGVGSGSRRRTRSSAHRFVYEERDLCDVEGEFDFAFMGYVLQVVTDALGALEALRRMSRELLVLDTVSVPLSFLPSPPARLDAHRDGGEWFVFNPRGLRKAVKMSGWTVQVRTGILADKRNLDWKHRVGVRGRACAILASA